ncbi:trypsin alpha-4-like isoform X2 [Dermacentor andersoni]|uniref:trypsin alpha-4-like isoform X2 n=1 Tax=Dermacentor andersoni TaxID=34620 RepID=UPI0024180160|nr:trypsin alpha-3-like isoform X2 [Dermacentor andersoni]
MSAGSLVARAFFKSGCVERAGLGVLFLLLLSQCLFLSKQANALQGLAPGEVGLNHKSCGIASVDYRIVNGLIADIERFPWVVFLQVRYRTILTRCAGSILTARHILTAGHCTIWTNGQKATSIVMLYGASKFSTGTKVVVKHFYRHQEFDFQTFKNDLAVLLLETPIKLGPKARTICLPRSPVSLVGETVVVAGWGVTSENGTGSPMLRYTTQVVWSLEKCIQGLGGIAFFKPQQICAYKKGSDACQGDSGAPLMLKRDNTYELVGLVSFGDGCNLEGVPGVYTNIEPYVPWIRHAIQATENYDHT